MVVLVTGASGQLGQALQALSPRYDALQFYFAGSDEVDITDAENLKAVFNKIKPDYCINTAAYTAVDKAESEPEKAVAVNTEGAQNIAEACKAVGAVLIHISTDFVFDGSKGAPYTEEDATSPQGVYGQTKRDGELLIEQTLKEHYIIRTSWLYSQYGHNFMKTMLRLGRERDLLMVVNDQTGTPTNANDLAEAIFTIILSDKKAYGTYHYSNGGVATWYDFAEKIFEVNSITINLQPVPTSAYPTPAKRPKYSVLDKSKIKQVFGIEIKDWKDALNNTAGSD